MNRTNEMTMNKLIKPHFSRIEKPTRSVLAAVFLGLVLTACGGGGGSGGGPNEMPGTGNTGGNAGTNDHSDTPDGATAISLDSSISGRIDSDTDVDHFRLGIENEGTLTISTGGNANPDIRVYDAGGDEIPGMAGSWIVVIDQSILDKGNYVIVALSGGTPGESYSAVASFEINDPSAGGSTDPIQAIPATIREGSVPPVYAQSAADTVDSMPDTPFRTLGSTLKRVHGDNPSVSLSDSSSPYVSSVTEHADGGATAVFVIDGQEHVINFPPDKFVSNYPESLVTVGAGYYQLEPTQLSNSNPLNRDYFQLAYWSYWNDDQSDGYDGELVYGVRTEADDFPMGTASYSGYFSGRFLANDGNKPRYATHRRHLWGEMSLEANLDGLTISGEVDGLWIKDTPENGNVWTELPSTTSIAISDGNIAGGRFVSRWAGQDTDPNNPAETSVRGFSGPMVGDFYGPNAEEVAGVFNGSREATGTTPEQFIFGVFGAEKDE